LPDAIQQHRRPNCIAPAADDFFEESIRAGMMDLRLLLERRDWNLDGKGADCFLEALIQKLMRQRRRICHSFFKVGWGEDNEDDDG
jgi:hypothetical protein